MVECMIKICSLDFLNKESFETDVMTADGRILFHSGEEITPAILLRLYFKEIFIAEPLEEQKIEMNKVESTSFISSDESFSVPKLVKASVDEEEIEEENSPELKVIETDETVIEENKKGPKLIEVSEVDKEEDETTSGPRLVETDDSAGEEEENKKGPRVVDTTPISSSKGTKIRYATSAGSLNQDVEEESNDAANTDTPLVFDEEQAKRIVQHSIKIGKMINFSDNDFKELEQVAYYCNIGISEFSKSDVLKKGFRKKKAFAGYEKLKNEGTVPEKIADLVRSCADNYESDAFPLDSKIPFHQIVAITSFYEELLQYNSKEVTLLKMLQIGGNQFNIFILHKFIKMMRED